MPSPIPAERFSGILHTLRGLVARFGLARGVAGPLICLIWNRLGRIEHRVLGILRRIEAGTLSPPASPQPRPGGADRPSEAVPVPGPVPVRVPVPRGETWLVKLIQETAASASHLRYLFADHDLPALFAAAPQLRRALQPLATMLGVALPQPAVPEAAATAEPARVIRPPRALRFGNAFVMVVPPSPPRRRRKGGSLRKA